MITATAISYTYPGNTRQALDNISFSIPKGTCLGLCGVNGSGKSTLLSLLAGLYTPTTGDLHISKIPAENTPAKLREFSSLVLQDADLQIIGSTVAEDMLLVFPDSLDEAEDTARNMASRFGLEKHWDSPVHTLSYGQKRKLCLAVALLSSPNMLLLDEPFSGLDYPAIVEMRSILQENKQRGLTQFLSLHDLEPVADILDYVLVLHHGRQVLYGPPKTVLEHILPFGVRPPCSWQHTKCIEPWV